MQLLPCTSSYTQYHWKGPWRAALCTRHLHPNTNILASCQRDQKALQSNNKTLCLCHDVSVMWLFSQCPIWCAQYPDTERWDHTNTFMSQHMLITFRPLSDEAMRADRLLAQERQLTEWWLHQNHKLILQVGFYNINWTSTRSFQELCPAPCSSFYSAPTVLCFFFLYLLPDCCDSDSCSTWYWLIQVAVSQDFKCVLLLCSQ